MPFFSNDLSSSIQVSRFIINVCRGYSRREWAHMFSCLVNVWLLSPCCVSGTMLITGDGGTKGKEWFCSQTCEEGSQVNSASVKSLEIGEVHSALGVHDWRNLNFNLIKWKLMCYLWKLISTFMKIIVFYLWKLMCPGSHSQ